MDYLLEDALGRANREKTLQMRIHHIFFELHAIVGDLKANGRIAGPRTAKYYNMLAGELERKLLKLKEELPKINYLEVK